MGTPDVEAVWRIESARIVAALTRFTGDFALAEDAAQEAVAEALVSWPLSPPANPAGWLMATARRRAIDAIRRIASIDEFPQDNEWIQKEREWRVATGQL